MQQLFTWESVEVSRPDRHSQWSPHRPRLLALPFVVLCAVVYLGSAVHFALVQHSTCMEHGDVIHLDEHGAPAQPQRLEASFTDERAARVSTGGGIAHGAEAHCAHVSLRREGLLPPAWSLSMPGAVAESGLMPGLEQLPAEPVARLRLAPKSSPPLS
jgi:hypothetical protein